jgi:hypothetical protein
MTRPERYRYWKKEKKDTPWQLIPDTFKDRMQAIQDGAMFFTWAALSAPYTGNGQPEQVRYGNLPLDFDDADDPAQARKDVQALCLVHLPETYNIDPYAIQYSLSGGKGFHANIPAEIFGAQDGDPYLPLIYKKIALKWKEQFELTTLDTSLYCMSKGKMFRIKNVKRSNGHYKVPLTLEEVRDVAPEKLLELSTAPRQVEPVEVDLLPNAELSALYEDCRDEVYSEIKEKKTTAPPSEQTLPKDLPPCIEYILTKHPKTEKTTFNKLTMDVISYLQGAGYTKDGASSPVGAFISGYPHSTEYTTPEARAKHFDSQWEYLAKNPDYSFNCSYILGKGFSGSGFDCNECDLRENKTQSKNDHDPIIEQIIAQQKNEEQKIFDFPYQVLAGPAGNFANVYNDLIESCQQFLYMAYLTCLGNALCPKLSIKTTLKTQPRLYVVLVGESADDRKSTAIDAAVDFFRLVLDRDFHYSEGVGSAEGLQRVLKKAEEQYADQATGTLLVHDEFKAFVSKCNIDNSVLLPCVNTLFEKTRYENSVKKNEIIIEKAYLSMLAASTTETYERIYKPHFFHIGFPNRIFLVPGTTQRKYSLPEEIPNEKNQQIKQELIAVLKYAKDGIRYNLTGDAREYYQHWYLNRDNSVHVKRMETYSLRLMMLLAANEQKQEIDLDIVQKATALCDWEVEVRKLYDPIDADSIYAQMEEKVRRHLSNGPMKDWELKRKTAANRAGLHIYMTALNNLQKAGEVGKIKDKNIWFLIEQRNSSTSSQQ